MENFIALYRYYITSVFTERGCSMNKRLNYSVFIEDPIIRLFTLINAGLVIAYLWISLVHVPQYKYTFNVAFLLIPLLTTVFFKAFDATLEICDEGKLHYTEKFLFFTAKHLQSPSIDIKRCKKWSQITLTSGNETIFTRFIYQNDEADRIVNGMKKIMSLRE